MRFTSRRRDSSPGAAAGTHTAGRPPASRPGLVLGGGRCLVRVSSSRSVTVLARRLNRPSSPMRFETRLGSARKPGLARQGKSAVPWGRGWGRG